MKKIALFIILFLLFLPVNVFGEDVGLNVYDEDDNVKYGVRFRIRYNEKNYVCITYYYSASGGFVTDCYDADVSERISISSVDSSFYFALNDEQIVEGPFYIKVIPKNGTNDIYGINITNLQYYLNQYPGATETNGYAKYPIFEIPDPSCLEIEGWNGLDDDEKKKLENAFS